MFLETRTIEQYRYERKFLVSKFNNSEIENIVKMHPSFFSKAYESRFVNNIYMEFNDNKNYLDSVEGACDRLKVRIRWYGDLFGIIKRPMLEIKVKKGHIGTKYRYTLPPLLLDKNCDLETLRNLIRTSNAPQNVKELFVFLKMALLNRYKRKYLQSHDRKFDITIDTQLTYFKLAQLHNGFLAKVVDNKHTIVELKYSAELDEEANRIVTLFPFRVTKSSKYTSGLECFF